MIDNQTIDVYDAQAKKYANMTGDANDTDPRLSQFIAACPAGGRVLDLGCGPGASAGVMAQAGLQVDATDASAKMVEMANMQTGVAARQANFSDLSELAVYDGIWANFSLLHAPRADMPGHLAAIHAALTPTGVFFIALKTGDGEARDSIGRFYTYYSRETLDTLLTEAGFTVVNHHTGRTTGLDGSEADWISVATHA